MSSLHKIHIDIFLSKFHENIEFIYGGVTENTLDERRHQHIRIKQPTICDSSWIISKKAITTINIKYVNKLEAYRVLISEIEQYLIDKLNKKFENKSKNDRNIDKTTAHRGGCGIQINNLQLNDFIKFYIFYKLK